MRRSNCFALISPWQPRDLKKNAFDKKGGLQENKVKKGRAPENKGIKVIK